MPKSKRQDRHSGDSNDEQPNASRESSCPYEILGVPRDATFQQIKVSYRKLALKHHPDRQTSESDKKVAHERFASIGHAYEILGDEGRRREYDEGLVRQQQQQARQQGRGGQGFGHDPFFSSMFSDPFFSSPFGGGSQRQRSSSARTSDFHFTDPFELFEQFFAEEMGGHRNQQHHQQQQQQQNSNSRGRRMDPFASDPFFSDPFSSSSFGGSMMGGSSLFGMHNQMMNSMMSQMHSSRSMFDGFDTGQSQQQIMMSSSSSTRGGGGSGHQSVSTSTRTTIVNGVRKTIHERTVVHSDGTVECHVTTDDGNDDVGRLSYSANNHPALDYDGGRSRGRRSR